MKWPVYLPNRRPGDDQIYAEIKSGIYTEHYRPKVDDVVVDAGAHIGFYTCYASKRVGPGGKIYAFEPEHDNFEVLLKHIDDCDLANVQTYNCGLWSGPASLPFYLSHSSAEHLFVSRQSMAPPEKLCPLVPLAVAFEDQRLDFFKIDVEGAEAEVVIGALPIIEQFRPFMAIEVDKPPTVARLKEILEGLDYTFIQGVKSKTVWHVIP